MFRIGRDELERRDALHNKLVRDFAQLEAEKKALALDNASLKKLQAVNQAVAEDNERLGKRLENVRQQRDRLQQNLQADGPHQMIASLRQERDQLQADFAVADARNERLVQQLMQADNKLENLLKRNNQ